MVIDFFHAMFLSLSVNKNVMNFNPGCVTWFNCDMCKCMRLLRFDGGNWTTTRKWNYWNCGPMTRSGWTIKVNVYGTDSGNYFLLWSAHFLESHSRPFLCHFEEKKDMELPQGHSSGGSECKARNYIRIYWQVIGVFYYDWMTATAPSTVDIWLADE